MYIASRFTLILAVFATFLAAVLAGLAFWPYSAVFVICLGIGAAIRLKAKRFTTLGSARFADEGDLRDAGMIGGPGGLILGRIPASRDWPQALRSLFAWRVGAFEACEKFLDHLRRKPAAKLVRASGAVHTAVFAPSGVGKGVSCILPFLLDCDESCVVVDFKGENALHTAEHRRKRFGHQVVLLDPFHVVTDTPDSFNPLDAIRAENPVSIDECNALAKSLVVRQPDEKDPHWNDSAEAWIAALTATVVRYGDPEGLRSLQTVRDLLSSPERIEMAIKLMLESDAWSGMLARYGGQLTHFVDREKSSTLSTVSRHLRFLDTPAIAASTKESSFDPSALRSGKMTIYLILPPEHMRAQSPLLRMWISSCLRAVVGGGLTRRGQVHFVLDEAASLGNLEVIEDAVDKYRGYGVRLQFYYQSLGQLKKTFPNGQDQTLLSNTTQIFFGVNDTATAELVSTRLGEYTAVVESGGSSEGGSWSHSSGGQSQDSYSTSYNTNTNWQQQPRKLLKLEEVIALPPRIAITFAPGIAPVWSVLLRHYEEPWLGQRTSKFQRMFIGVRTFAAAAAVLTASVLLLCMVAGVIVSLANS
jgi:type IV secretion system protein VirD4